MARDLFELFPDLPWHTVKRAGTERRRLMQARVQTRLSSVQVGRDTLRRIRLMALNGRRHMSGASNVSRSLEKIIAIAETALQASSPQTRRHTQRSPR